MVTEHDPVGEEHERLQQRVGDGGNGETYDRAQVRVRSHRTKTDSHERTFYILDGVLLRALLIPIASWFGAGLLPRGARAMALATALPIAIVLTARWPTFGCLVGGLVIAAFSALAARERARAGSESGRSSCEIVGGSAAALMFSLVPARPSVIQLATAFIGLALCVHARPQGIRAIDQRASKVAGDLALGIAVGILVAVERMLAI